MATKIISKVFPVFMLLGLTGALQSCSGEDLAPGEESSNSNEAEITDQMIAAIKTITESRAANGVVPRLNQAKSLGCLNADFTVEPNLPDNLRHGLFAQPGRHRSMVRFANASEADDREKDFRGMSIKVFDVAGQPLWGQAGEQDFLMNSYPALFASNPEEFLSFIEATADDAMWKFFINPFNVDSLAILLKGREKINSPFDIDFWSTTPYRLGPDATIAVKYAALSCTATPGEEPDDADENFLRTVMQQQLTTGGACFDFMVQFQQDPKEMPIEDASVIWDEEDAPYQKVATITFAAQDFSSNTALQDCDSQRFNPWQSLSEHRPVGGINRVRQAVYSEAGEFRLQQSQR
ncbi:MAG: catalase family protein [Pseudomonadota bacterium]